MRNIRKDSISGVIDNIGASQTSIHFSEWWGKEGMDFVIYSPIGDETTNLSLTRDELSALVSAAIASGYVDGDSAVAEAKEIIKESNEKAIKDAEKRLKMNTPNSMTLQGDLQILMEE